MKIHLKITNLLFIIFCLLISDITTEESIPFNGEEPFSKEITGAKEVLFFKLSALSESKSPKYVKVLVKGKGEGTQATRNHVLSAYKLDNKYENREQMAQSRDGTTVMWLTKAQIKEDKVISVECIETPCDYEITFSPEETIELEIGDQYTYYVSNNNKEMEFAFIPPQEVGFSRFFNVWAQGGAEIKTDFQGDDYEEFSKKNKFIVNLEKSHLAAYFLKVTGTVGDLINVGSSHIKQGYNLHRMKANSFPVVGFLKKGLLDEICYEMEMEDYKEGVSLYLTGYNENKIISIYLKDNDGEIVEDTEEIFGYGSISELIQSEDLLNKVVCLHFPKDELQLFNLEEIVYSIQLTTTGGINDGLNVVPPLINGKFYPWYLQKGDTIGFSALTPNGNYKEINYNMLSINDEPEMMYYLCENYPLCLYNGMKKENIVKPHDINKVTTWSIYKSEINWENSPISKKQSILVVNCPKKGKTNADKNEDEDNFDEPCGFGTIIYSDLDRIKLIEGQYFSQLLLSNEKDLYAIDYSVEKNIQKIYLDVLLFSGEITLEVETNDKNTYHKYYSANKIFLSITVNKEVEDRNILFYIKATKNAYYTIQFSLVREDDDRVTNELPSGMSYLVTVDPLEKDKSGKYLMTKNVKFENLRQLDGLPYFVNFYSINCKFVVETLKMTSQYEEEYSKIETVDYYSQDIIKNEDILQYYSLSYDYKLNVAEMDYAKYNKKLCMVYATGIELEKGEKGVKREIVVGDNNAQQIIFKKGLENIKYLYPHTELQDDVVVRFSIFDKAKYKVKVFFEFEESPYIYDVTSDSIIYLDRMEWGEICTDKYGVCNIIIDITMEKAIEDTEPMLEIAIKPLNTSTATYIQKSIMRHDNLHGKQAIHFYTDIGTNEEGFALVNFQRGSGRLYGKIVSKNQKEPEKNADFRGMYKFPTSDEESLIYEGFTKKLTFQGDNTNKCEDGCFLLLTLVSNIEGEYNDQTRCHPFTLIVQTAPTSRDFNPTISIPLEEYVIGNLAQSETTETRINEYYSVWLTHDAESIIFDLQSDGASLFIRVGENTQPQTNTADFKLLSVGRDMLFTLTKDEILKVAKDKKVELPNGDSLKDLCLTIGVWTNVTDSVYTTIYSFKVHLSTQSSLDIYKVNSDQKVLCKTNTFLNSEKYANRCLFVIEYDFTEPINNLLLYPVLQDQSASYQIYANYIDKDDYETWNEEVIREKIPTKNSQFSTDKTKLDYIYTPHGEYERYLFVNVVTNKPTIVELMSTFYTRDKVLSPNPSTPQLFTLKTNKLTLDFSFSDDYIVNFISLSGEAQIYWENSPSIMYYLRGRDDKLSITSNGKGDEKLVIENLHPISSEDIGKETDTDPGFAFYMTHTVRSIRNIDEIVLGKSTNFVYSNSDLPIILYSKIQDFEGLNIFFTFYEMTDTNGKTQTFFEEKPVSIYATLLKESLIYSIKNNPEIGIDTNKATVGVFDTALKTGFLSITKEEMNKIDLQNEGAYLYILVSKNPYLEKIRSYRRLSYEITVNQENSQIPSSEKIYQYGNLPLTSEISIYILRTSLVKRYMRIEFAANSGYLDWAVSTSPGSKKNDSFVEATTKYINGRTLLTFSSEPEKNDVLFLSVFHKEKKSTNPKLTNFVFKYINTENVALLKDYEVKSPEIKLEAKQNEKSDNGVDYTLTFDPIPNYKKLNISYLVKFVSQRSMIPEESYETIALTQSNNLVKEFNNPPVEGDKLSLLVYDVKMKYEYIQVIAQINDYTVNEYIAYKGTKVSSEVSPRGATNKQLLLFIIIGVILLIAVISLVVIVVIFNNKNKDLLKKVEKISFQQDSDQKGDGGLLLNSEQNALD